MLGQYIKDLSFESPGAPEVLQSPPPNPQLQVTVNVTALGQPLRSIEVILSLEVHAKSDTGVIYNIELLYGGLFRLRNIPQNMLQPVLFVDCATILFPYARRVLSDMTRDGGFPPLMLDPIDFARLYTQNLARGQLQAAKTNWQTQASSGRHKASSPRLATKASCASRSSSVRRGASAIGRTRAPDVTVVDSAALAPFAANSSRAWCPPTSST